MMTNGSNKLLDIREASDLLRVPDRRLRDHWKTWGIKAYKLGRELRFRERDLWSWLEQHPAS